MSGVGAREGFAGFAGFAGIADTFAADDVLGAVLSITGKAAALLTGSNFLGDSVTFLVGNDFLGDDSFLVGNDFLGDSFCGDPSAYVHDDAVSSESSSERSFSNS